MNEEPLSRARLRIAASPFMVQLSPPVFSAQRPLSKNLAGPWNGDDEAQCCRSAGRRWRAMTHRLGSEDVSIRVVSGE